MCGPEPVQCGPHPRRHDQRLEEVVVDALPTDDVKRFVADVVTNTNWAHAVQTERPAIRQLFRLEKRRATDLGDRRLAITEARGPLRRRDDGSFRAHEL